MGIIDEGELKKDRRVPENPSRGRRREAEGSREGRPDRGKRKEEEEVKEEEEEGREERKLEMEGTRLRGQDRE